MKKGFVLTELLIVIAFIIILAAILLPFITNRVEDSKIARMRGETRSLKTATILYYNDLNVFPNTWNDLVNNSPSNPRWRGPYIEKPSPSSTEVWTEASPWKTNYILLVTTDPAGFYFAGQPEFVFVKGIGLEITNPETPTGSGMNRISPSSLNKIDDQIDDGSDVKGLIVGRKPNGSSLSNISATGYNLPDASVYILLQGIR
ncbi:MAG: hypothetical protein ABDH21_00635 [bacterium]